MQEFIQIYRKTLDENTPKKGELIPEKKEKKKAVWNSYYFWNFPVPKKNLHQYLYFLLDDRIIKNLTAEEAIEKNYSFMECFYYINRKNIGQLAKNSNEMKTFFYSWRGDVTRNYWPKAKMNKTITSPEIYAFEYFLKLTNFPVVNFLKSKFEKSSRLEKLNFLSAIWICYLCHYNDYKTCQKNFEKNCDDFSDEKLIPNITSSNVITLEAENEVYIILYNLFNQTEYLPEKIKNRIAFKYFSVNVEYPFEDFPFYHLNSPENDELGAEYDHIKILHMSRNEIPKENQNIYENGLGEKFENYDWVKYYFADIKNFGRLHCSIDKIVDLINIQQITGEKFNLLVNYYLFCLHFITFKEIFYFNEAENFLTSGIRFMPENNTEITCERYGEKTKYNKTFFQYDVLCAKSTEESIWKYNKYCFFESDIAKSQYPKHPKISLKYLLTNPLTNTKVLNQIKKPKKVLIKLIHNLNKSITEKFSNILNDLGKLINDLSINEKLNFDFFSTINKKNIFRFKELNSKSYNKAAVAYSISICNSPELVYSFYKVEDLQQILLAKALKFEFQLEQIENVQILNKNIYKTFNKISAKFSEKYNLYKYLMRKLVKKRALIFMLVANQVKYPYEVIYNALRIWSFANYLIYVKNNNETFFNQFILSDFKNELYRYIAKLEKSIIKNQTFSCNYLVIKINYLLSDLKKKCEILETLMI